MKVNDVDELRQRIWTVWDELDQRIIDKAIKQWRTRVRACVEAKGGHFEHRMIISMNVSHFIKICQVLTILHQLISRGVANFGTRCMYVLTVYAWQILCIHLKRFRHEFMFSSKIGSYVSFPLEGLDMRPYLHKG